MKQRQKKKQKAPRATHLNEVLCSKVAGSHEPKQGKRMKRARVKAHLNKVLDE